MAVKLVKPVRREMLSREFQQGKYRGRSIIVELLPGDELSFRTKGTRQRFSVYLGHCYRLAQIMTIESEYKAKLEAYNLARKTGKRVKRPRRPSLPFNKVYFEAIKR